MSTVRTLGDLIRKYTEAENMSAPPPVAATRPLQPVDREEHERLRILVQEQAEMITELRSRVDAQAAQIAALMRYAQAMGEQLGPRVSPPPWSRPIGLVLNPERP